MFGLFGWFRIYECTISLTFPLVSSSLGLASCSEVATSLRIAITFSPALCMEPSGMAEGTSYLCVECVCVECVECVCVECGVCGVWSVWRRWEQQLYIDKLRV